MFPHKKRSTLTTYHNNNKRQKPDNDNDFDPLYSTNKSEESKSLTYHPTSDTIKQSAITSPWNPVKTTFTSNSLNSEETKLSSKRKV